MSETNTRKFSPKFQAKGGWNALRGIQTSNGIGRRYGIHPVTVGPWKKKIQDPAKTLVEGRQGPGPRSARRAPARLCRGIGRLKTGVDRLERGQGAAGRDAADLDRPKRGGRGEPGFRWVQAADFAGMIGDHRDLQSVGAWLKRIPG